MLSSVVKTFQVLLLLIFSFSQCGTTQNKRNLYESYEPTWESLDKRPLPQWYDNAKVGIFIHWGLYSVPSYGSEWFWYYLDGTKLPNYVNFIKKNYKPGFTYQEFAKDFTAELFDADQWAKLFEDSGAKYVVLTSKHHEGYTLWPSSRSFGWNSKDIGPNKDIISELSTAIRTKTSLKFGLYYSLYEWFNRMYISDRQNKFKYQTYVHNKVHPELQDLIHRYKPEILWSDGDQEASPSYWNSTEFIAWLYNSSPVRKTIVTNDRWGKGVMCAHGDFYTCADRYNPGVLQPHKWENAFTIDKTTWGHRFDTTLKDYMSSYELIKELVITVSCGGNVLVNIGPTRHGTIEPIFEERLRLMGTWLKINGEAIYDSRPWIYQNDTVTSGVWYTKKDEDPDRINVYAMILEYPYLTNEIDLYALGGLLDDRSTVELVGYPEADLLWFDNSTALHIEFPPKNLMDNKGLKLAYTIKINIEQ